MRHIFLTILLAAAIAGCSTGGDDPQEPTIDPPTTGGFKPGRFNITPTLCTPDPSKEAINVYNFLKENFGKKIISGAMSKVSWNMEEVEWIHSKTGKYPALWCVDYIHLAWGDEADSWTGYGNLDMAQQWWDNHGLMSASWHWCVPKKQGDTAPQDRGFYTKDTSFDVSRATLEGSYEKGIVDADLAKIAVHLKRLKDRNIPLLWRPLHEASGAWFWWGTKGPESFKKLWIYMFDYFKAEGLNNLIWVWTSQGNDIAWYPGDAYVDMVGYDSYPSSNVHASLQSKFDQLIGITGGKKILTLSECGGIPAPENMYTSGDMWSWFMPWYGDYTSGGKDNSESDFRTTMNNGNVLTRDKMPSLK